MRAGSRPTSWGRWPRHRPARVCHVYDRQAELPATAEPLLAYGNGRSYGDSCLNDGGVLLLTRPLDRFIVFDAATGVLRAEAGVLLAEILDLVLPRGWFLPVTPGTRFVTLGGAVANDIHGKNHHVAGSFGCHVRGLELLRSDGRRRVCSRDENADWFAATIGGLGLTGLITWVEIALKPVPGPLVAAESLRMRDLEDFFRLSAESDRRHEYTVAWIDCMARGHSMGRGVFLRGVHAGEGAGDGRSSKPPVSLPVPFTPPFSLVKRPLLRLFNAVYSRRPERSLLTHYEPFFFPLDRVRSWNRLYGPRGFLQYQCVIPHEAASPVLRASLERVARSREGSFLSVLKVFGELASPGLLSFPRPGVTLALDFPHRGASTLALLDALDDIVVEAGGALYPAKDARMSPRRFRQSFPRLDRFREFVDPAFSSSFWRRVGGDR